jgi:hypothetical protein
MKPQIEIREVEMEDPTFQCGSSHTATAKVKNPTDKSFTYNMELYLDVTKVASASKALTIPAGGTQDVDFSLVMPADEGTWKVYLDVKVEGELIAHFQATEDIVTVIPPNVEIVEITWE